MLSRDDTEWGSAGGFDLSEPILDVCKVDVEGLACDDEFKKARDEFIGLWMGCGVSWNRFYLMSELKLIAGLQASWGLPITNGTGVPRTEWYHFTKTQSAAIIRAVKTRIGPQYTISHLGHAATVLALLKARPLPAHDTTTNLNTALPVNGRKYIRDHLTEDDFLQNEHAHVQYGSCQAGAVVEFPNLAQWTVDESDNAAVSSALEGLARHVKQSYDYWISKPFLLALGVSKDNFLSSISAPRRAVSRARRYPFLSVTALLTATFLVRLRAVLTIRS